MESRAVDVNFDEISQKTGFKFDSLDFAKWMDRHDPLREFRDQFHLPTFMHLEQVGGIKLVSEFERSINNPIYLCGNSLGLQPKNLKQMISVALDEWAGLGLHTYHSGTLPASFCDLKLSADVAKFIVGAESDEVTVTANLSVNMHSLLATFYRPSGSKNCVLLEECAFPTDLYAISSHISWHQLDPKECIIYVKPRQGEYCLRVEDIIQCVRENSEKIALVWLPGIQYITGQCFDIELITSVVHEYAQCPIGWDLAHSVGNVPLHLHNWNVDVAVWCSYKYLNGSPGALGGLFVHRRHHHEPGTNGPPIAVQGQIHKCPQLTGWWSHRSETRFDLTGTMELATGAAAYRISNPPLLLAVALTSSMEIFKKCGGMEAIRQKSILLTGYLMHLLKHGKYALNRDKFSFVTPEEPAERGSQLTICVHEDLDSLCTKLFSYGFVFDIRRPNFIRITPTPLYNQFEEILIFASHLHKVSIDLHA